MNVIGTIEDPVDNFDLCDVVALLRRQTVGHKVLAEGFGIVEAPLALVLRLDDLVRLQKHLVRALQRVFHCEKLLPNILYKSIPIFCMI